MTWIALVTGGNRGIGFEICRGLGKLGMHVILAARQPGEGERACATLQGEGLAVTWQELDVRDPQAIRRVAGRALEQFGRVDVLVNNAGVYLDEDRSVFDLPVNVLQETLEVNLTAPLLLCQALVPAMKRRNYGRVVNVSSEMGQLEGMGGYTAAYRISKAALNALTGVLAAETRSRNLKINSMCPGWVRTRMGGASAPRSVEQGADTALWLATLPDDGPSGGFFKNRKQIHW